MALMLLCILFRTDRADVIGNELSRFVCEFYFILSFLYFNFFFAAPRAIFFSPLRCRGGSLLQDWCSLSGLVKECEFRKRERVFLYIPFRQW